MRLGDDVLVEIVSIFQEGLSQRRDVSEQLRSLDLVESDGRLSLTKDYLLGCGRVAEDKE